jgi:hypothetical protein
MEEKSVAELKRLQFIGEVQARVRKLQLNSQDSAGALTHLATIAPLAVDQALSAAAAVRTARLEAEKLRQERGGSRRQRKRAQSGS